MSRDLDDILDAAGARDSRASLIEVGRKHVRGHEPTVDYFWSTGRVMAAVGADGVCIKRRFGTMTDGVRIDVGKLRALAIAVADWARQRERWAAFYFSTVGYSFAGAIWYQPPGISAKRVMLGRRGWNVREGEGLVGRDEIVPIAPSFTSRAPIVAEIWRCEEHYGPKEGSLVGLRYALGDIVKFDAHRVEARVWRGGRDEVYLEPGEEDFVAALLDLVGRT